MSEYEEQVRGEIVHAIQQGEMWRFSCRMWGDPCSFKRYSKPGSNYYVPLTPGVVKELPPNLSKKLEVHLALEELRRAP